MEQQEREAQENAKHQIADPGEDAKTQDGGGGAATTFPSRLPSSMHPHCNGGVTAKPALRVPRLTRIRRVEADSEAPAADGNDLRLQCERCTEDTTIGNSSACNSSNPMKRKCKACISSDNSRAYDKKGNPQVEKDYKQLSPNGKVRYYKTKKRAFEATGGKKQRKVAKIEGTIAERNSEVARGLDEDDYEPFEDYAVRKIILRECVDKAGAWKLFEEDLKAGRPAMQRRGVWCIGRYAGFKVQTGTETALDATKAQKRIISDAAGVEEFNKESLRLRKRARKQAPTHSYQVDGAYTTMEGAQQLHPSKVEGQVSFELKEEDIAFLDGSA